MAEVDNDNTPWSKTLMPTMLALGPLGSPLVMIHWEFLEESAKEKRGGGEEGRRFGLR